VTALERPTAPSQTAIDFCVPVPSSLRDPSTAWLRWLTTEDNRPVDDRHPLGELCRGECTTAWNGTLFSGMQPWRVRADRIGDQVEVYAWMADELLRPAENSDADAVILARDVAGRVLGTEQLAQADALFRSTIENLHQAIYLYRPIWREGRIVDLEIIYCNAAALALPFTEAIVPGALASNVFRDPEKAMVEAEEVWRGDASEPYSIERPGLIDGLERVIRYEVRTVRVGDLLLQTSTDRTAEDELARADERQRLILDTLNAGVTLLEPRFDRDGRMVGTHIVYANNTARDMRDSGIKIFTGAEHDERELDIVRLTWETGDPAVSTIDNLDGREPGVPKVRVELEAYRVKEWIIQIARDRTESFTLLKQRESAERRFRGTIEALSEAVGIWDPIYGDDNRVRDFKLRYANPSLARLVPVGARASFVPTSSDLVAMGRTAMVLRGQAITLNVGLEFDNEPVTWRISLVQVDGQIVSMATDISEMQEVLGRLSNSEVLLRSVLDSLTESVRVLNGAGVIEYANEASYKLLGGRPTLDADFDVDYHCLNSDGSEMPADRWPLARGLTGESFSGELVAVQLGDAEPRVCSVAVRPLFEPGSTTPSRIVVSAYDVTDITRHADELAWLATHSTITRLPNREGFVQLLEQRIAQAKGSFSVLWVTLEELETIRPTFGFAAADAALVTAAERLSAIAARVDAIAAHPEESALALLVPHVASGSQVQQLATEIVTELGRTVASDAMSLALGPVAGLAIGPLHGNDAESLIRRAKTAAWHAARNGTSFMRWRADLGTEQIERVTLLGEFERAMANEEVFLEFQPKVNAISHDLVGAEALVRWMHPERGRIAPNAFVGAVEASALSRPFTLWAIRSALTQWRQVVDRFPGTKVAVNVPVPLVCDLDFMEQLADELVSLGVDPTWLQVEITERGLIGNLHDIQAGLEQLSMLGISVALDDFGTGQSGLAFLRTLSLDEVKVDRTFITNLQSDSLNKAVVSACVAIANTGRMRVCAEGVETEEELAAASALGCHYAQGYLLGRPMAISQLLTRLD
jgi:EAL domain-containing protein (putative c-di-GMP-specific phosphodiesterase class I)/PAS domain-containing protein